jgi:hypothetical protein
MKQYYLQKLRLTKVLLTLLVLIVLGSLNAVMAQAPQAIPYQGVARNASGNILSNQNIGLRLSIRDLTAAGAVVYSETHTTVTTNLGLFNLNIGSGTPIVGTLAGVNWGVGAKFIKVEMDPTGGITYIDMGTTQLNSVPYALFAGQSGSTANGTLNFVSKWTPNGTTLGNSVLFDDGTNVGLSTPAPAYKFDVLHGGATGIRSKSSASFSVVDIDATSGDAALRFQKAGVNQWNIRNRPADDYLEIFELGGGGSRMVIQDATGNVGIGETTSPAYRLDVLHGGSTGIRSRSSASFSVVDIDAQSGDAALRFQKAGVNQWNIRNRPADDYLEIFELGGGGSRMVIQDATGNVGIGETTAPAYKLDVLHGGSTGIRSRSSASFSVVDIDGQSGDAALRFQKAGVNQWNVRNRPSDDYFEIFELGGGGSRVVIQDATGNVGIGETTAPAYKLDVLHGGATGIRSRSSATFSVVDIDGQSGDAALRFQRAGVNQWNTRNNPANDDYQIFELGGGGERMRIENTTGKVVVDGDFTVVGVKMFTMDHPLDPENKILMHAAVESDEVINLYSGNITTDASGKSIVNLPDYFEAINKDFRYQLTVIGTFAQAIISKEIVNNQFVIATSIPNVKVSWEVKGVRNDARMKKFPFVAQQEKIPAQKGKYWDPSVYNQPESRSVSFAKSQETQSSLSDTPPALINPKFAADGTSSSVSDVVPKAIPNPITPDITPSSVNYIAPKAVINPITPEGPSSTSDIIIKKK